MRGFAALVCLGLLLPACRFSADYDGTGYRCKADGECPVGQTCQAERCVDDGVFPDGAPPNADADTNRPDAALAIDASPERPDAAPPPPNLLVNGDIEGGVSGWNTYQSAVVLTSTMTHGGTSSLKVCKVPDGVTTTYISVYIDAINGSAVIPPGTQFTASVWARASVAGEPPPAAIRLVLREANGLTAPDTDHFGPYLMNPTTTWTEMTAPATIEGLDHRRLSLIVEADNVADGMCFIIDDAYVGQLP